MYQVLEEKTKKSKKIKIGVLSVFEKFTELWEWEANVYTSVVHSFNSEC